MANYTAPNYTPKLPEIADYQSTIPLELMGKVGMTKESQYLAGEQQLQAAVDKLNQYPITKDVDREVIHKKMSEMVTNLNSYSGQDLGDSKVLNNLLGYTSAVYNDEDVHQRLVSNMWDAEQIKKIQKSKDDNPDEYNPLNEQDYHQEREKWLNDPNQKNFKYTYKPYYNDHDENMELINSVLKNPDIEYKVDANGVRTKYLPQELKEVKAKKIAEVLFAGRSSRAKAQDALEYKVLSQSPQYSLKSAITEVTGQILEHQKNIEDLKNIVNTTKNDSIRKRAQQAIEDNTKILLESGSTLEDLQKTGDPREYYTFGKFMHGKIDGIAKGFAYKQEGKLEESQFALENLKQANREKLAKLKASLVKDINSEPAPVNTFKNEYVSLKADGEAVLNPQHVYAMAGLNGKVQTDGSMDAVIGSQNQAIDFVQIASSIPGLMLNKQKADGWNKYLNEYTKWTNTNAGQNVNDNKGINQYGEYVGGKAAETTSPKSIQEFGQYLAQSKGATGSKLEDFMKEYNFNPTNDEDVNKVKKIIEDPKLFETLKATSKLLDEKTKLKGTVNLVPQNGVNTIVASNGKVYNRFYLRIPKKELEDRVGGSNIPESFETNTYPIYEAGNHTGEPNKTQGSYQLVPLSIQASRDIKDVNAELVNNDKVLGKHAGVYSKQLDNIDRLEQKARVVRKYSEEEILNTLNKKLPLFVQQGISATDAADIDNKIKAALKGLKEGSLKGIRKLIAEAAINNLYNAKTINDFNLESDNIYELTKDPIVSKKETDYMSFDTEE